MTNREYILQKVKNTVLSFDSNVDVVLYGSRVKGTASPESDWDFLILTNTEYGYEKKREIRNAVHLLEIETGEIISVIIHSRNYWNSPLNRITPFYKNISRESISL